MERACAVSRRLPAVASLASCTWPLGTRIVPPSWSSYGILASLSFWTMAASSSLLRPENATALSGPLPTVVTTNSSPPRAARTAMRPISWPRLRPAHTRWTGAITGLRASIYRPDLNAHPHDFGVAVDQLVSDLDRPGEAQAGLFGGEHDLVNVDRVTFCERQRRRVGLRRELVQGAYGL